MLIFDLSPNGPIEQPEVEVPQMKPLIFNPMREFVVDFFPVSEPTPNQPSMTEFLNEQAKFLLKL